MPRYPKWHEPAFMQAFDWMGMHRHLRSVYRFALKYRRDNKPNYLGEIAPTLKYVIETATHYPQLHAFKAYLENTVLPTLAELTLP